MSGMFYRRPTRRTASATQSTTATATASHNNVARIGLVKGAMVVAFALVLFRLCALQVFSSSYYSGLAAQQHQSSYELMPKRGVIYVHDPKSQDGIFPVAVNKTVYTVYANGKDIEDIKAASLIAADVLKLDLKEVEEKLSKKSDPYIPLAKQVSDEVMNTIKSSGIKGFGFEPHRIRYYPEGNVLSQVVGFVNINDDDVPVGKYGIEGWWNKELSGKSGFLSMERDPLGRLIGTTDRTVQPADNGVGVVLTIDRAIQYVACDKLQKAMEKHQADSGSVVIMNPKTGAVLAMCNAPTFDPNDFSEVEDLNVFNNTAAFTPYEPGSIFKAVTLAAAVDAGVVTPETTYEDLGFINIGPFTIRNSDGKANGVQTMTDVLEKSLNTGTIFAAQQLGPDLFRDYVEKFGFGKEVGLELQSEAAGNVSSLSKKGEIWSATGSYGQGITVTALQMAAAYSAIANEGRYMKPYIVDELRMPDGGVVKTEPKMLRQVISKKAAELTKGMLVTVVEDGHGKKAGVEGYYVAGKTGTAQIANSKTGGYETGAGSTVGSFTGFAPVDDPAFVMIVKIDRPKDVAFAESSAAPLFGEIAEFLLHYLQIPPSRE